MSIMQLLKLAGCCCRPKIGVPPPPPDPTGACCVNPDTSECYNNKTEAECLDIFQGDWYEDETCADIAELCSPVLVPCSIEACDTLPTLVYISIPEIPFVRSDSGFNGCDPGDCEACPAEAWMSPMEKESGCGYHTINPAPNQEEGHPCFIMTWDHPSTEPPRIFCVREGDDPPGGDPSFEGDCPQHGDKRWYMTATLTSGCAPQEAKRALILVGPATVLPYGAYSVCEWDSPPGAWCDPVPHESEIVVNVFESP